jgi:hypothetical protein
MGDCGDSRLCDLDSVCKTASDPVLREGFCLLLLN